MTLAEHEHQHAANRFAVVPTNIRLNAHKGFTGRNVTIAFLDSGFYPHPDLVQPTNRIFAYHDVTGQHRELRSDISEVWQWHGTQTSVAAAGNGNLCDGLYRGVAHGCDLVLVKVSESGRITEESIARGIEWVVENRKRYNIQVLNISLGADEDVPCSKSIIDQVAEEAIAKGIVVVAAAGNSGHEGKHSIPPANSPSVITVGGYSDNNQLDHSQLALYQSNFGFTADGTLKPEIIAPAMWVAAPILPETEQYRRAEALSQLLATPDYELPSYVRKPRVNGLLPDYLLSAPVNDIRAFVEAALREEKIVSTHYQHVDGTSFAAPIVSSIVAQMLEANPKLTPAAVKNILIATASRISGMPVIRQGYGVVNAQLAVQAAIEEIHELESPGCGSFKGVNGKLQIYFHDDRAESVAVAGEFNNWQTGAVPLQKTEDGLWQVDLDLPPGRYEYKFVVNGHRWVEDPNNGLKVEDNHGGLNSVFVVT